MILFRSETREELSPSSKNEKLNNNENGFFYITILAAISSYETCEMRDRSPIAQVATHMMNVSNFR